jgi:hypothetical protein
MRDIKKFVVSRVDEAIIKERILCGLVSNDLRKRIIETLIKNANGMFRLPSLHIESLCDPAQIKTTSNVLDALAHLPRDLQVSYDSILTKISSSQYPNPELANRILKWLLCAQVSLSSQIFIFAVGWDINDQDPIQLSDVLSICCNLVVYDEETDRFRFAHLSVQEYLERLENFSPAESNALAAEQCLSWLDTQEDSAVDELRQLSGKDLPDKVLTLPARFITLARNFSIQGMSAFSTHADVNWWRYAQLAGGFRERGRLRNILQKFLLFERLIPRQGGRQFVAWFDRIRDRGLRHKASIEYTFCKCPCPNPLFVACALNLPEIVKALVNDSASIILAPNHMDLNCVKVAGRLDHLDVLEILLSKSQYLQSPESYIRMAIFEAASMLHVETLEMVLARGGRHFVTVADIVRVIERVGFWDRDDRYGLVLQLLFDNSIDIEVAGNPLRLAIESDYDGEQIAQHRIEVIRIILRRARMMSVHINAHLLVLLTDKLEVTWEIVGEIMKMEKGDAFLQLLLEEKLEISLPALHMLISFGDEATMQSILGIRKIKVTDHVIRAVAGNVEHGEKILRLLLEREAEETGASEIRKISVENIADS